MGCGGGDGDRYFTDSVTLARRKNDMGFLFYDATVNEVFPAFLPPAHSTPTFLKVVWKAKPGTDSALSPVSLHHR